MKNIIGGSESKIDHYVGLNQVISKEQFDEIMKDCDRKPPIQLSSRMKSNMKELYNLTFQAFTVIMADYISMKDRFANDLKQ